jgi:hypothetical protein
MHRKSPGRCRVETASQLAREPRFAVAMRVVMWLYAVIGRVSAFLDATGSIAADRVRRHARLRRIVIFGDLEAGFLLPPRQSPRAAAIR